MSLATTNHHADPGLPLWREAFAGLDWLDLRLSPVFRGEGVERGRGQAVVLVPGLFAADASMKELSRWLERCGYRAYESGIGMNVLRSEALISRLVETTDRAHAETGAAVRIIGHSLGGVIARGAALRRPDRIAQVITLGSPVQGLGAHPAVLSAARLVHGDDIDACLATVQKALARGIDETNIYSKSDGVVDWRTCYRDDADAIEVRGSHTGLIVNAAAYRAIAYALAANAAANEVRATPKRSANIGARGVVPASSTHSTRIAA
jgi:pimeloyl-ACP methyl ester carboxylesterase